MDGAMDGAMGSAMGSDRESGPDRGAVRTHYGLPTARSQAKQLDRIDAHARAFIALSPFCVVSSADARGRCDATPRGDAPGFVAVPDPRTLLIPDRPGNRRIDTMLNVAENPRLGLLFLVPGLQETLRVNGRAVIVTDPEALAPLSAQGKLPCAALRVSVEEAFFHCGKAVIRSNLWARGAGPRPDFPTLGQIFADQIAGADAAETDRSIEDGYRNRLY